VLDFDEKIDLDALFDTLNLAMAQSHAPQTASGTHFSLTNSSTEVPGIQELSSFGGNLFPFDASSDQS
jgi:hypothetical protein